MADRFDEQMFLDYVEGDLDQQQKYQFESLIEQDSSLRTLVTTVISDRQQLRLAAKDPVPPDLMDRALGHLERHMLLDTPSQELDPMAPQRRFRLGQYVAVGGLAAMVLVSTAIVVHTLIDRNLYDRFAPSVDTGQSPQEQRAPAVGVNQPTIEPLVLGEARIADQEAGTPLGEPALIEPIDTLSLATQKSNRQDAGDAIILESVERALEPPQSKELAKNSLGPVLDANSRHSAIVHTEAASPKPGEQLDSIETFARLGSGGAETSSPMIQPPNSLAQKVFKHMAKTHAPPSEPDGQRATERKDLPTNKIPTSETQKPSTNEPSTVTVRVHTPNATATQHALLVWAVANEVRIVSLTDAASGESIYEGKRAGLNRKDAASRRMTLAMTANQFQDMLPMLNETADRSVRVLEQVVGMPRGSVEANHDDSLRQIPRFADLDWAQILEPNIPLRPVVPTFRSDAQLMLTVEIYESQQNSLGQDLVQP